VLETRHFLLRELAAAEAAGVIDIVRVLEYNLESLLIDCLKFKTVNIVNGPRTERSSLGM
jgi:hypothetical protein